MVKNLSCVSCAARNVFLINSLLPGTSQGPPGFKLKIKINLHCLFSPSLPLRVDVYYEWSLFEWVNDTLGKSSPW